MHALAVPRQQEALTGGPLSNTSQHSMRIARELLVCAACCCVCCVSSLIMMCAARFAHARSEVVPSALWQCMPGAAGPDRLAWGGV